MAANLFGPIPNLSWSNMCNGYGHCVFFYVERGNGDSVTFEIANENLLEHSQADKQNYHEKLISNDCFKMRSDLSLE